MIFLIKYASLVVVVLVVTEKVYSSCGNILLLHVISLTDCSNTCCTAVSPRVHVGLASVSSSLAALTWAVPSPLLLKCTLIWSHMLICWQTVVNFIVVFTPVCHKSEGLSLCESDLSVSFGICCPVVWKHGELICAGLDFGAKADTSSDTVFTLNIFLAPECACASV